MKKIAELPLPCAAVDSTHFLCSSFRIRRVPRPPPSSSLVRATSDFASHHSAYPYQTTCFCCWSTAIAIAIAIVVVDVDVTA